MGYTDIRHVKSAATEAAARASTMPPRRERITLRHVTAMTATSDTVIKDGRAAASKNAEPAKVTLQRARSWLLTYTKSSSTPADVRVRSEAGPPVPRTGADEARPTMR